jgi:uncharacterized protein YlzI (FlbEa/FlbD family)
MYFSELETIGGEQRMINVAHIVQFYPADPKWETTIVELVNGEKILVNEGYVEYRDNLSSVLKAI